MKICFHTNMPSFHQEQFFSTLSKKIEVLVKYEGELTEDRVKLGWQSLLQGYNYEFENKKKFFEKIFLENSYTHIISSFPGSLKNYLKVITAKRNVNILFQSEHPSKKTLKWTLGANIFKNTVNNRKIFLLGTGLKIRDYWKKIGVNEELFFPWCYYVEKNTRNDINNSDIISDIIFVGQLIHRKGVDVLLNAFKELSFNIKNNIKIIGTGEDKDKMIDLTKNLGLTERVSFIGSVSSNKVQEVISHSSILVLPSRYDGWGVVVNEAILNNVPVVVSDQCGAKELVEQLDVGLVFKNEDSKDLSEKLLKILTNQELWLKYKDNCKNNSHKISPESASNYLIEIIKYRTGEINTKPIAPWFKKQ